MLTEAAGPVVGPAVFVVKGCLYHKFRSPVTDATPFVLYLPYGREVKDTTDNVL